MDPPSEMSAPAVQPSDLEVDFDRNITKLYSAITSCNWNEAIQAAERSPVEAKTWVVRHYDDQNSEGADQEIMWRFLPIHSACARQPPSSVIAALIRAYPDGPKCVDDQGMYALHYACGNQANRDVIRQLLISFPEAAKLRDPRGMLPIHYLACWGPSSISVIDMVLVANRDVANAKDEDGNTPLDLAREGEYPDRDAVVAALTRWLNNTPVSSSGASTTAANTKKNSMKLNVSFDEKKEGDDTPRNHPVSPSMVSPSTVGRLRQEIASLQKTQRALDQDWEGKLNHSTDNYRNQINELAKQMKNLETEVSAGNQHIADLEQTLQRKEMELQTAYETIKMKDMLLDNAYEERDGLRQTLADLTDQHDRFKRKSEILSDRLGSLNASLYTMMDQQQIVMNAMRDREEQVMTLADRRREKLRELVALEEDNDSSEDPGLNSCLMKQSKEMEAIYAVIAAVRQAD